MSVEAKERALASTRAFWYERRSAISTYKLERGCADCGYNTHPEALEFDHVWGEKLANVNELIGARWDVLFDELEKCEVVCSNCHRVRTILRLDA